MRTGGGLLVCAIRIDHYGCIGVRISAITRCIRFTILCVRPLLCYNIKHTRIYVY